MQLVEFSWVSPDLVQSDPPPKLAKTVRPESSVTGFIESLGVSQAFGSSALQGEKEYSIGWE